MFVLLPTFLFLFKEGSDILQELPEYLLKYISNDTYKDIIRKTADYTIENLVDNRIDVDLNIRYLLKIGVKNIDIITLERLDDLLLSHNTFIDKMNQYEEKLTKEGLINMLENS